MFETITSCDSCGAHICSATDHGSRIDVRLDGKKPSSPIHLCRTCNNKFLHTVPDHAESLRNLVAFWTKCAVGGEPTLLVVVRIQGGIAHNFSCLHPGAKVVVWDYDLVANEGAEETFLQDETGAAYERIELPRWEMGGAR